MSNEYYLDVVYGDAVESVLADALEDGMVLSEEEAIRCAEERFMDLLAARGQNYLEELA